MTDFYNGKPLNVKRMETPGGVQKDKSVKFDKETGASPSPTSGKSGNGG